MTAPTAISRGQRAAERLMRDTCTIRRRDGYERVDGVDVPKYVPVYAGKCKVQAQATLAASAQEIGGDVVTQTTRRVDLPMSAPEVLVDDEATIDASLDSQLVGKTLRVTSTFGKTYATARRLEVKEP